MFEIAKKEGDSLFNSKEVISINSIFDQYPCFRQNYRQLDEERQEELFALSCYHEGEYERYKEPYPLDPHQVMKRVKKELPGLFGEDWEDFQEEYVGVETFVRRYFFGGAAANHLLAWYLEEETGFSCDPELRRSDGLRFDVEIFQNSDREERLANIFIKRIASTKNLDKHMGEFEKKKIELDNSPANICLNLVFSAEEDADRLKRLLIRYGYMSSRIEESCFSDDDVFLTVLPAVENTEKASFTALGQIKSYLEDYFKLTTKD